MPKSVAIITGASVRWITGSTLRMDGGELKSI